MADSPDNRWAPWYVYLVAIVGSNLLKQQFMEGVAAPVNVGITVVLVVLVVALVTWVWRATHRQGSDRSSQ
ncbi:hypothetical protein EV383_5605 [Pseudonocardia sediminis]|uniref:Uncharacterized protein n=1 Tax=Pseudonocardia sediminis TaxID=1397368 RepID=A0A4Q7V523_PSEST|nr:hypothetical protein [Pseudonocardia sediminis]RZT88661.1 hypothetical protein EV383_5605 [Pseudonocardia sediminis]